ncbi:Protein of unknown function [Microbulbifer donghaiensis]|uniref:DUF2939 domain-containing protein n=1 Tax=Microbulbifer donghaiensis TaxID=494016 RepID=A0A1M5A1Y5_9GAMM|nr:DUF2939 domain-containing protein [Microbulbifer donghaiensis]SHF24234.1 Protein of unknown function [Microbulbifer donghaiensis]
MKKWLGVALLSLALIIIGYVALPGFALEQLEQAAQAADAREQGERQRGVENLRRYVDFPVLRDNLKLRLQRQLRESMGDSLPEEFDEFLVAGANLFIGPLLNQLVTPEGIADLLRGGKNMYEFERDLYRRRSPSIESQAQEHDADKEAGWQRLAWRFVGLNRVTADYGDSDQAALRLELERRGLRWQLVDIELLQTVDRE